MGNSVEYLVGITNIATFAIHVNEGIGDSDGGRGIAEFDDVGMNLFAEIEVVEGGGGLENGRKGKVVRWDCSCHGGVGGNGVAKEVGAKRFNPCGFGSVECGVWSVECLCLRLSSCSNLCL